MPIMSTLADDAARPAPTDDRSDASLAGGSSGSQPAADGRSLREEDELVLPLSKGAFAQYREEADRPRELRIFYRDKEIAFDDPAFFGFGENLIRQSRFRAGDAVDWGRLEWPKVREMLEQLIAARVLHHADGEEGLAGALRHDERASPLKPAPCPRAMSWDESEEILRMIAGNPLETGYLELVVPVFRVAHMYLDADDRQIGEANVFPPLMRLDRPTLWRTCTYSGSRYQPDRPMNVTALRAMRAHWRQMMAIVRRVSDAYKARFPAVGERGWTVGDIERMTICVMALPSYMVMKREGRVENGRLHPALSSAFRLADGPRTLMHNMVFAPFGEPARSGDTPMTGAELHAYAERNDAFRTSRGICAGPPAMIDDVLAVMLDGEDPKGGWPAALDPEVTDALGQLEPAIDYALTGLQAYAAVFSLFTASAAAQAGLRRIVLGWKGPDSPRLAALRAWLEDAKAPADGWEAQEDLRLSRLAAYDDIYRQCGFGLTGLHPDAPLIGRLGSPPPLPAETMLKLEAAFARHLGDLADGGALCAGLAECLGRFIAFVQAALAAALEAQGRINALLGRPAPAGPFLGRDLVRYVALGKRVDWAQESRKVPFLVDEVADLLGVTIDIGTDAVTIAFRSRGG
jgi:hypothetical protein